MLALLVVQVAASVVCVHGSRQKRNLQGGFQASVRHEGSD
jgi:hypothetical protein